VLSVFFGLQSGCLSGTDGESTETIESEVALPPPDNLTVTVTSTTRMDLAWDASPGATKYVVLRGLSPGTETTFTSVSAANTTFAYGHLSPNTTYCWEVVNVSSTGQASARSNEVCAATSGAPEAPANVTATANSASRITLNWSPVDGATFYSIDMAEAPGTPTFLATVRAPTTSFVAAGLKSGTTYVFAVHAVTAAGTSTASGTADATTFVAGLEGYWKLDDDAGATARDSSGFNRTGALSGGAAFTSTSKPNVRDNPSTVSIPAAGTGRITVTNAPAFNFIGAEFSVALWVNIPTAATTVHIIGQRAAGCGAIGWELAQLGGVLTFSSGNSTLSFGTSLVPGAWTHLAVTMDGDSNLVAYVNGVQVASSLFTVIAHSALPLELGHVGGCAGGAVLLDEAQISSRAMSAAEVATIGALPAAPLNLTATTLTSRGQELTWTAVAGAAKYIVFRGTAPGNETPFTSTLTADTTFRYGNLDPNTQYSWQVSSVRGNLFSLRSNEAVATTLAAPAAPAGVTATAQSATRVRITWAAVTGAVTYQIFESVSGGAFAFKTSTTATTVSIAGLLSGTTYAYQVRAIDGGNTVGTFSAAATVTTP